jgi:hypothetical protein
MAWRQQYSLLMSVLMHCTVVLRIQDELEVQLSGMRARAAMARTAMSKDADGRRTSA